MGSNKQATWTSSAIDMDYLMEDGLWTCLREAEINKLNPCTAHMVTLNEKKTNKKKTPHKFRDHINKREMGSVNLPTERELKTACKEELLKKKMTTAN